MAQAADECITEVADIDKVGPQASGGRTSVC